MNIPSSLFPLFSPYPHLFTTLSTKKDGGMKIRYELEKDEETLRNRENFLKKFDIGSREVVVAQLAQDNHVLAVSEENRGRYIPKTDGLVTDKKRVFLSVTVADCLPIFIFDPKKKVIGLVHAGWRGLDKKIIHQAINLLKETYASKSEDLLVGIGPGIGVCHFAVNQEVLDKFVSYSDTYEKRDNQYFLDLKKIAKQQLIQNNILEKNIEISPFCTYCEEDWYFSYRRERSNPLKAMVAIIGLK